MPDELSMLGLPSDEWLTEKFAWKGMARQAQQD